MVKGEARNFQSWVRHRARGRGEREGSLKAHPKGDLLAAAVLLPEGSTQNLNVIGDTTQPPEGKKESAKALAWSRNHPAFWKSVGMGNPW